MARQGSRAVSGAAQGPAGQQRGCQAGAKAPVGAHLPAGTHLPRLVFSDLDGTFVTTHKEVPRRNWDLLDRLATRGIPFVPCTGRSISGIPDDVLNHPASRYAISCNGVMVQELPSGRILHADYMGKERTLALYQQVKHLDITYDVFIDGKIMCEKDRYDRLGLMGLSPDDLRFTRKARTRSELLVPQVLQQGDLVERVTVYWRYPQDRDYVISRVEATPGLVWTSSVPHDIEIMDQNASKGAALTWLCQHLGVSMADVVAFGDAANDMPMLQAAGDGVAMANALPEVIACADHVAPSNDEAGVAQYLESLGV